jgi:hypothetical protein
MDNRQANLRELVESVHYQDVLLRVLEYLEMRNCDDNSDEGLGENKNRDADALVGEPNDLG